MTKVYDIELNLVVIFESEEIKFVYQGKAYPFWSFGAEVGGYVGMFLGYSIIQVPDLISSVVANLCRFYERMQKLLY